MPQKENTEIVKKTCFQFQPLPIQSSSIIQGSQQQQINLQFISCLGKQCMAWDESLKACKLCK